MDPEDLKNAKQSIIRFLKSYIFVAQPPSSRGPTIPGNSTRRWKFFMSYKRWIGLSIPCIFFWFVWLSICIRHNVFVEFLKRYRLSIITVFGATAGGITSIGGGVVAFPVMTLGFTIPPPIARDFSIMCQATAMLSACFMVFWMKMKLEWRFLTFSIPGMFAGVILGFELIDNRIPVDIRKLCYTSIWSSCAFGFFLMQWKKQSKKYHDLEPNFGIVKSVILVVIGLLSGMSGALVGVDYVTFPIRTLLFRVHDKVAIPTSIVLMTVNTLMSFYWRQFMSDEGIELESWKFLAVVVPIVALCGPFGAFLAAYLHGYVKAFLVFALSTVALVSSLSLIPMKTDYWILVWGLISSGCVAFTFLYFIGVKISQIKSEDELDEIRMETGIET